MDVNEKIRLAKEENWTSLDLRWGQLTQLPEELFELKNLKYLDLSWNRLCKLTEKILELKNLICLKLVHTGISDLPKTITELKKLRCLDIACNQIGHLPKILFELKDLVYLDLGLNEIRELPEGLFKLKNLIRLDLKMNYLKELPIEIVKLKNLTLLDISNNHIKKLPKEIVKLDKLDSLIIKDNILISPPTEIANQGFDAIRNYFESIEKSKEVIKLYEAKLIIVGEANVGKTSIVEQLKYRTFDEARNVTEGIETKKWEAKHNDGNKIEVNIWDFGGQEINHATHQFFLTERCLYLLVWDKEHKEYNDYWLNTVKFFGKNSPVIMVQNKTENKSEPLDRDKIKKSFGNVERFIEISCKYGKQIKHLDEIVGIEMSNLDNMGSDIPIEWIDVRKALEGSGKNYIKFVDYVDICKKYGVKTSEKARHLSTYLHELGVILYHKDNEILKNIIILKPSWATDAVYKVINSEKVKKNLGRFTLDDLYDIWNEDSLKNCQTELLHLMKDYDLCFRFGKSECYIVPQLLEEVKGLEIKFEKNDKLVYELEYEFMPPGILTKFMVRRNDLIFKDGFWKNCVLIKENDAMALIESLDSEKKILVKIVGWSTYELFILIRDAFSKIHKELNNPMVKECILCNCDECRLDIDEAYRFEYRELDKRLRIGISKAECRKNFNQTEISSLLQINEFLNIQSRENVTNYISIINYFNQNINGKVINMGGTNNFKGGNTNNFNGKDSSVTYIEDAHEEVNVNTNYGTKEIDFKALYDELSELLDKMNGQATETKHYTDTAEIAKAKEAAKEKDENKLKDCLLKVGKWTIGMISSIGASHIANLIP